jgi:hypothetical protein
MPVVQRRHLAWRWGGFVTTGWLSVFDILADTYTPQGVSVWLSCRNRNLGDQSPVDLLKAGRLDEVLAEARRVAGDDHE